MGLVFERFTRGPLIAAVILLASGLFASGCGRVDGGAGGGGAISDAEATAVRPETAQPTATPSTPRHGGYQLVPAIPVASFEWMLGFAMIPGSDREAVIVTKMGEIWRVRVDGGSAPILFGDLSEKLIEEPHLEEGLLGLALSPAFQDDGLVYVHYSAGAPRRSVISRFDASSGALNLTSEQVILKVEQPFGNHNGGQIAFGLDGYLYIGFGDGGDKFDPFNTSQRLDTLLGKILRIDVSGAEGYRIPPDNPFVDTPGARPEIYAYGLRNPWRFTFDRVTGDLWVGDVGQDRWEEVNRIVPGANYGWSTVEGPECLEADCNQAGLQPPRAAYARESANQAVIGGYVYRGPTMPELNGWYIYGDWGLGKIWAVDTEGDAKPVLLADTGLAITSFGELDDGEIVVVTFNGVYKLALVPQSS
jgi:glucose/arabinose dehydrogenase